MWTLNATWSASPLERLPWTTAVAGVMGVVAIVTVMLNLLLMLSVLVHQTSRSRSFHLHIVNMTVIALVQGGGVLPLWIHYLFTAGWIHGDLLCRWWLAADTLVTSLSATAFVVTACDRFIYLACWRFVKEGGKYVTTSVLMALTWLFSLTFTLTLTLLEMDSDEGSFSGVQGSGSCEWGTGKDHRVLVGRLIMYGVGAGLGFGLCFALATLPCLGIGGELPVDEDNDEVARKVSLMHDHNLHLLHKFHNGADPDQTPQRKPSPDKRPEGRAVPSAPADKGGRSPDDSERGHSGAGSDYDPDFPHFIIIKKTDRLEERERWKGQMISLLTVAFVWVVFWLPSHLFVFADHVLGLEWSLPHWVHVAAVILGYTHAAIAPLMWLMHQPLREDMASLITCRCCKNEDDEDEYDSEIELREAGPYRAPHEETALT